MMSKRKPSPASAASPNRPAKAYMSPYPADTPGARFDLMKQDPGKRKIIADPPARNHHKPATLSYMMQ